MATPKSPRRVIVSAALGRYSSSDANATAQFGPEASAKVHELLQASISKAAAAGFDVVTVDTNPADPQDNMQRFEKVLREREVVGLNVGFGVRGHKEHTVLFERIVNTALQIRPGLKLMFSNGPDDLLPPIQRNFPDVGGD